MNNNLPRVSVITVCYNAVSAIQRTILSVLSQTYENIEYIIIDGKSTDGTLAIIKKYESRIAFWLSEPDNGIYDAMNKAIDKATGEWVLFMNADDEFVDNKVVERFAFVAKTHKKYAAYYGDTILRYGIGERPMRALGLKSMRYMMAFTHKSVFILTDLMN